MLNKGLKSLAKLGSSLALLAATATTAFAQCNSWESYPKGAPIAKEQHVIYRDMFKSKKYAEAFPTWKELFQYVQAPAEAKSRHFQDGIQMYNAFAAAEADATKKAEHIAALMKLYDQMAECLGEQALDRAYEGYYLYALRHDSRVVVKTFEKSMELGKDKTPDMVLQPLAQLTVYMFQYNMSKPEDQRDPKFTPEYMRNLYDQLKGIIEKNGDNAAYKDKWPGIQAEFDKIGDAIWGCDFHVGKWKPVFEGDKMNMEQNAEILKLLKVKCGEENELFQTINALYTPWKERYDDSIAEVRFAELCNLEKGKFRERGSKKLKKAGDEAGAEAFEKEAYEWYEKSLEDPITEDCNTTSAEKGELAYSLAYRYYRAGNYSKARSLCNKAASLKSGWGEPYMLIGTMYAASGKRCDPSGKGTGWDAQVVVWAAMDMWQKAKSVDPGIADKASKMISKYYKYLPTKGDIFQRGLKEGASYKINCWIGVTTTIRAGGE